MILVAYLFYFVYIVYVLFKSLVLYWAAPRFRAESAARKRGDGAPAEARTLA